MLEEAAGAGHDPEPVRVSNRDGKGIYVLTCDHASNHVPAAFGRLGLAEAELSRHIAWDPGALPVAQILSEQLDAPLIESGISRLVIDCNRPLDAPDLMPPVSETTEIPGNRNVREADRLARIERYWRPFHDAVGSVIEERLARGMETRLVSIHSFTPVYKGISRPWQIGIVHDEDERLSQSLIKALRAIAGISVGDNEPYAPADRVYFTLEQHGRPRGLACAMIELRNDEVADEAGQARWAGILTTLLGHLRLSEGATA